MTRESAGTTETEGAGKGGSLEVEVRRVVRASREAVWSAFTEPGRMTRWMCPEGATLEGVTAEVRPGGTYRLPMRGSEGERWTARGAYRAVEPPARLVFTWDWEEEESAVGETVVTVRLEEVEDGTEVVIVHRGFPAAEAADGHRAGWESTLGRLEAMLEG